MRLFIILIWSLCLMISCNLPTSQPQASNQVQNTCNCQVQYLSQRGMQYWFSVKDFDAKNPDCFKYLRQFATSFALDKAPQINIHFFDNLPDWVQPADGRGNYGGQKVMDQEILLYERLGGQEFYRFDHWETGKYKEI